MSASILPEGLRIMPDFVTPAQEAALLAYLDTQPWTDTLSSRRQQFYGVSYSSMSHSLSPAPPLTGPLLEFARRLVPEAPHAEGSSLRGDMVIIPLQAISAKAQKSLVHPEDSPSKGGEYQICQCIVNRYGPQGSIGPHTDDPKFGPVVYGLSLGSPGSLAFSRGTEKVEVYLPPRSLMIMAGPSRYEWKHALKPTRRYTGPEGLPVSKGPDWCRTSLTFRSLQN